MNDLLNGIESAKLRKQLDRLDCIHEDAGSIAYILLGMVEDTEKAIVDERNDWCPEQPPLALGVFLDNLDGGEIK